MNKKDFQKKERMVVTSVRVPKDLLRQAKDNNLNLSLVMRDALIRALKT